MFERNQQDQDGSERVQGFSLLSLCVPAAHSRHGRVHRAAGFGDHA
jgi:hypothetical protein